MYRYAHGIMNVIVLSEKVKCILSLLSKFEIMNSRDLSGEHIYSFPVPFFSKHRSDVGNISLISWVVTHGSHWRSLMSSVLVLSLSSLSSSSSSTTRSIGIYCFLYILMCLHKCVRERKCHILS